MLRMGLREFSAQRLVFVKHIGYMMAFLYNLVGIPNNFDGFVFGHPPTSHLSAQILSHCPFLVQK